MEQPAIFRQHRGVDPVGLGQESPGAGEVANVAGVEPADGQLRLMQRLKEVVFVAARGFANQVHGTVQPAQGGEERPVTGGIIGKGPLTQLGMGAEVEGEFGDVQTDIIMGGVHGEVEVECSAL